MRYGSTQIDAADLALINADTRFVTTIFLGRGRFDKHSSTNLAQAREVAAQMTAHYKNGRVAMVYAMLPGERQVLVPETFHIGETAMESKPHAKRFNAQRQAKSALGPGAQEGVDFTTSKNADGLWEWIKANIAPAAVEKPADQLADDPISNRIREGAAKRREKRAAREAKPKPAKAAEATRAAVDPDRTLGKRAQAEADARAGIMPDKMTLLPADKRYQKFVDALHDMADKGDAAGLRAYEIKTYSSTPKRMAKWRDLAVLAIEAKQS